jgi:hypothetical protein
MVLGMKLYQKNIHIVPSIDKLIHIKSCCFKFEELRLSKPLEESKCIIRNKQIKK